MLLNQSLKTRPRAVKRKRRKTMVWKEEDLRLGPLLK
jgi:hypothetical protein